MRCGKIGMVNVDENELFAYLRGELAQDAFPTLTRELREQIISGTHPECWTQLFGEPEPDEDEAYERARIAQWEKENS